MNKTRLLMLADALEKSIPAEKFNLESWRRGTYGSETTDEQLVHGCGSAGCAVGWACALPEFQRQGLVWNEHGFPEIRNSDHGGWDAVEAFFAIDEDDAQYLFDSDKYRPGQHTDPLAVARRIRAFVADGDAS
ncbi:hypothetical protein H4CHR_02950 [Variovorax sp. PBS-H4]|uniref:hypothetical protein n=1 Tax=Variovorax sp. PBS-H4 TaxID=434008 RepID=UPI001317497E|nr:hypothetical protein [Variovorax sp. PBS-H4]VTU32138.1 hypothetical protein H4CHR_02950 [Variovorax sp. PBS-H4]